MKSKIQINSISGKLLFEYECEDNTMRKTIEEAVKGSTDLRYADLSFTDLRSADLRYADLRSTDLRAADLRSTDLRAADLRSTDLSFADLSSADLRSANLSSANLSYAKTDKRYIQIACIGSVKGMTTYCFEDDEIMSGCFRGTLKEFEEQVKETHKDNEQYLKEYMGFINYLKSLK